MLTEVIEYIYKIEEAVKAMQSDINKIIQGTNGEGKETRTEITDLEQKEEINIQLEQIEETRILKNEKRLRNHWGNFKHSNIWIIGAPEGEEEDHICFLTEFLKSIYESVHMHFVCGFW